MRKLAVLSVILVILLTVLVIHINSPSKKEFISPVNGEKVLGINQWLPKQVLGSQSNAPQITSKAGLFIEIKTGQILYEKNIHNKLPIASLVKVMTVLVALEHK